MSIKRILVVGMIIASTLVISSIALTSSTVLQASSKGLKLYLTVDTNLNDDVRINTYQHGDSVFIKFALTSTCDENMCTL
ncbi:MAG: hypothetical protein WBL68_03390 [Nitrososphaeraceae archaeon]